MRTCESSIPAPLCLSPSDRKPPGAIARIFEQTPVSVGSAPLISDTGITSRISAKTAGVRRYRAVFADGSTADFIGKQKSVRIILNGIRMVSGDDLPLTLMLALHHKIFGYSGSAMREAVLYGTPGLLPESLIPRVMGSVRSNLTGECFLAMEILPESEPPVSRCTELLEQLAALHAHYLGRADRIRSLNRYTKADYRHSRRLLHRMFDRLSDENAGIFGEELTRLIHRFIDRIDTEFAAVAARRTLTHNDCCDRNLCISGERICLYDWELACCQNPEHDVVELLISLMHGMTDQQVREALAYYRTQITALSGIALTDAEYRALLRFNTLEFTVNKLCILRLAGRHLHLDAPRQLAMQTARMIRLLGITS